MAHLALSGGSNAIKDPSAHPTLVTRYAFAHGCEKAKAHLSELPPPQ